MVNCYGILLTGGCWSSVAASSAGRKMLLARKSKLLHEIHHVSSTSSFHWTFPSASPLSSLRLLVRAIRVRFANILSPCHHVLVLAVTLPQRKHEAVGKSTREYSGHPQRLTPSQRRYSLPSPKIVHCINRGRLR